MPGTLMILIVVLLLFAGHVWSQETHVCTDIDPGPAAEACTMLQLKLQEAIIQNPVNLDKLHKAFSQPIPSIINVTYAITWGNTSNETCSQGLAASPFTLPNASNYLWTNIPLYATLSPQFLQQIQLQIPYVFIKFAEKFFGEDSNDHALNSILWDGCSTGALPSTTLSLHVESLPCIPSQLQIESSIQEVTTWVRGWAVI